MDIDRSTGIPSGFAAGHLGPDSAALANSMRRAQ